MSLSVKLFIKRAASDETEVRRLSIDQDVSASYDYLTAKIRATVPSASHAAIRLFWKDEEGEMISFSGDDELVEALGHINDGVFRVHVELGCSTSTSPVNHAMQPHHCMRALSSLLAGSARHDTAGNGASAEPGVDSDRKSGQEKDHEKEKKDETCHTEGQDIRQIIVDTANAFLEPLGLKVVDQCRQSCDKEPAAGASMTSSQDPDAEAGQGADDGRDSHAANATDASRATATGRLNELLSALGFDAEVGSWLSNLIIHHAGHVTQASSTAPAAAKC